MRQRIVLVAVASIGVAVVLAQRTARSDADAGSVEKPWALSAELRRDDPTYGRALAIHGEAVAIAWRLGVDVYAVRDYETPIRSQLPAPAGASPSFGSSVALHSDGAGLRVLVGDPGSQSVWLYDSVFSASPPAARAVKAPRVPAAGFGEKVAVNPFGFAVSAPGADVVFVFDAAAAPIGEIQPPNPTVQRFGRALAPRMNGWLVGFEGGAVSLARDEAAGTEPKLIVKQLFNGPARHESFGESLSSLGDNLNEVVLIGAPRDGAGVVHSFVIERSATTESFTAASAGTEFGRSLQLSADQAVIGGRDRAFVYRWVDGKLALDLELVMPDPAPDFGIAVSSESRRAFVGAAGGAFYFRKPEPVPIYRSDGAGGYDDGCCGRPVYPRM